MQGALLIEGQLDNVPQISTVNLVFQSYASFRACASARMSHLALRVSHSGARGSSRRRWPHELSGGKLRRVVNWALVEPAVLLLDEPLSALAGNPQRDP